MDGLFFLSLSLDRILPAKAFKILYSTMGGYNAMHSFVGRENGAPSKVISSVSSEIQEIQEATRPLNQ